MAKADMYLKLTGQATGPVKGGAMSPGHADEIEVIGWSWGMKGPNALGGAGAAARTSLSELRIVKRVDPASTALMSVMRNNEVVKKAVLSVCKAGGTQAVDYFVITIENGRITALDVGTERNDEPDLLETLSIAFEKIEVNYAGQGATGGKLAKSSFEARVSSA